MQKLGPTECSFGLLPVVIVAERRGIGGAQGAASLPRCLSGSPSAYRHLCCVSDGQTTRAPRRVGIEQNSSIAAAASTPMASEINGPESRCGRCPSSFPVTIPRTPLSTASSEPGGAQRRTGLSDGDGPWLPLARWEAHGVQTANSALTANQRGAGGGSAAAVLESR